MANDLLRAGRIWLKMDGQILDATGAFTYNLGALKREGIAGADRVHGYVETVQVPSIEGKITDRGSLDVAGLMAFSGGTVTIELANGKTIVLSDAWYASEGSVSTEKAEIDVKFEGLRAQEV